MGYEINVSLNGQHYFATAERSLGYDFERAKKLVDQLRKAFPKEEGFRVTIYKVEKTSKKEDY